MTSKVVKLYYNPKKYLNALSRTSNSQEEVNQSPVKTSGYRTNSNRSTPSRIVRIQYNNKGNRHQEGLHIFSSSSNSYSRSPTPLSSNESGEVATINNSQILNEIWTDIKSEAGIIGLGSESVLEDEVSWNESKNIANKQSQKIASVAANEPPESPMTETGKPIKSYKYSLESMNNYQQTYLNSSLSADELERTWLSDIEIVSERLHFLKEVYKTIQIIKKRMLSGKIDKNGNSNLYPSASVSNSDNYFTPLGSDDETLMSSQNQQQSPQQHDEDSSSNSNTDSLTPLGKRIPKKRVQFSL